ncbi:MAG: type transport system ATP-binding protein, partial [Acidimicrobiaceae bacterium]
MSDSSEPTPAPAVRVRALRKTWPGGMEAVRGIDFDVAAGEVFGLLGPNGAGKSTTIGMLTTTVAPTSGYAELAGCDVEADPIGARSVSGVVFQDAVVDRALTGRRNLETHARLWGVAADVAGPRIEAAARDFGLTDLIERSVATYSGGQRRRLEIARALLSEPQVLFLDEPTVGLDPRIRHELLDLIGGLRRQTGMTVVLTTHYLDEAERLCDRIGIMHEGEIVALDSPANLLAGVSAEVLELRFDRDTDAPGALATLRAEGIAGPDAFVVGTTITVPVHDGPASETAGAVARLGVHAAAMSARRPTLDDV